MSKSAGLGTLIFISFRETYGAAASVIALLLALVLLFVVPSTWKVDGRLFLISISAFLFIFWVLVTAAINALEDRDTRLPRVVHTRGAPTSHPESPALILVEETDLFSFGSIVSIYVDNEYEELFGFGSVVNVQQNGLLQVVVNHSFVTSERWGPVAANDASVMSKIRVKPQVPAFATTLLQDADNLQPASARPI